MWGGEAGLEEAKEDKAEKREVQKQRRFDKKVKGFFYQSFLLFYYQDYEYCNPCLSSELMHVTSTTFLCENVTELLLALNLLWSSVKLKICLRWSLVENFFNRVIVTIVTQLQLYRSKKWDIGTLNIFLWTSLYSECDYEITAALQKMPSWLINCHIEKAKNVIKTAAFNGTNLCIRFMHYVLLLW